MQKMRTRKKERKKERRRRNKGNEGEKKKKILTGCDHRVDVARVVHDDKLPVQPLHMFGKPASRAVRSHGGEPSPNALHGEHGGVVSRQEPPLCLCVLDYLGKRVFAQRDLQFLRNQNRVFPQGVGNGLPRRIIDGTTGRERGASEQRGEARLGAKGGARVLLLLLVSSSTSPSAATSSSSSLLVSKALVAVVPIGAAARCRSSGE